MLNSVCNLKFFREEFSLEKRKLRHHDATDFCRSQWQHKVNGGQASWSARAYVAYRWCVFLFVLFGGIAYDMLHTLGEKKCRTSELHCKSIWFIYLTNWNTFLLLLQTGMATFLVTRHHFLPIKSGKRMQIIHRAYWAVYNMSTGVAPIVTIMYWGFVHDSEIHIVDYANVREHAVFTVIVLLDLLICAHPIHLMHVYQPVALGLSYVAFSALYYFFGGVNRLGRPYIYAIMDWDVPDRAAAISIITILFECVVFFCVWTVHLIRRLLAEKCLRSNALQNGCEKNSAHEFGDA
ncbi:protein rolling stone-like [Neocloeon triangulifer]|uniref:protein rolling stone-like n=1 Tax=Neocloeon triangulifer TaxID=2078957 RepID=UPI00286EF87A|nr:protein rolling stone-like [Neocloeon triangulifer]